MNNNEKMEDFMPKIAEMGVQISRNYFRPKPVFIVILWDGLFNEFRKKKKLIVT